MKVNLVESEIFPRIKKSDVVTINSVSKRWLVISLDSGLKLERYTTNICNKVGKNVDKSSPSINTEFQENNYTAAI